MDLSLKNLPKDGSLTLLLQFSISLSTEFFKLLFFKNKNQAKIIPVFHATVLHQVLRDFFVTGLGDVVLFKMSEHSLVRTTGGVGCHLFYHQHQ